ncbi:MAG: FecCD family ABC transporter permease [Bacillota bacterium]
MPKSYTLRKRRIVVTATVIAALSVLMIIVSCMVGSAGFSMNRTLAVLGDILSGRASSDTLAYNIIAVVRLPRALLAFFTGAALAVSGTCMQGVFKNPMAEPSILGVSAGAGLGATVATVSGAGGAGLLGTASIPLSAFVGSLGAVLIVYQLSRVRGRTSLLSLLLAGTALSSFLVAIMQGLMVMNHDKLAGIISWLMGSFGAASWQKIAWCLPLVAVGCAVCTLYTRDLNAMLMGDEEARSLGVHVPRVRLIIIAASTLAVSAAVAACGIIGFVGLMVPHGMRLIVGPDHRVLLPFAFIGGGLYMLVMDLLARIVIAPMELPVGVLTAMIGGPFFIYLLRKGNK